MIQLSILKISGYGPWTLTLGSDREHALQMLQASLYKEIKKLFSEKNCLVFLNRADEFFVVSNGLILDDHIEIQKNLEKSFDVKLSMSIGYADSPYEITSTIFDLYAKMSKFFLTKNSLAFFMGGDNFMVVANDDAKNSVNDFIKLIEKEDNITLNCGIGNAKTAREAVKLATKSLDTIREIRDSGKEKPNVYELSC